MRRGSLCSEQDSAWHSSLECSVDGTPRQHFFGGLSLIRKRCFVGTADVSWTPSSECARCRRPPHRQRSPPRGLNGVRRRRPTYPNVELGGGGKCTVEPSRHETKLHSQSGWEIAQEYCISWFARLLIRAGFRQSCSPRCYHVDVITKITIYIHRRRGR